MRPEISVIGATVSGNRGAEAMLCTVVGELRRRFPTTRFNVYSYYPERDRALVNDPDVTFYSATPVALVAVLAPGALLLGLLRRVGLGRLSFLFPRSVRALYRSRALVDVAGVSFIDGREIFLPFNMLTIWPAFLLGVPVFKLAQAMGPFNGRLNRLAARMTLTRCRQLVARGGQTHANLKALGLKGPVVMQADDVAFSYSPDYSLSAESEERLAEFARWARTEGSSGPLVGVCPSSVVAKAMRAKGQDYEQALLGIVEGLLADGYRVVLFPNACRAEDQQRERNNDVPMILRLRNRLHGNARAEAIKFIDFDINTSGVKRIVAPLEALVTSRFHAMIASLTTGVPVVVVGWSHKYHEVMERFGLERYVLDHKDADSVGVLYALKEILAGRDEIKDSIAQALPGVQASSRGQFEAVAAVLPEGPST